MATDTMPQTRPEAQHGPIRSLAVRVFSLAAVVIVIGVVLWGVVFAATGGRWFVVSTPSMGQTAPVGSIIMTRPVTAEQIAVGDVITFNPPTSPSETFSHRVHEITPEGGILTRGDINGAIDPWELSASDVVGEAQLIVHGVGWLIRALPLLTAGLALVWAVTRWWTSEKWTAPIRLMGYSFVVALTSAILKPFIGIVPLEAESMTSGADATVVSTGLLPTQVVVEGGDSVNLVAGQVGELTVAESTADGYYQLSSSLHLTWWGWAIALTICSTPLVWALIAGRTPRGDMEAREAAAVG